jgi:Holliday junction DNA helicase RuvB
VRYYTEDELVKVLERTATIIGIKVNRDGLKELAARARGTPRIANNLLKRVRDFGIIRHEEEITKKTVMAVLESLKIDNLGLDNSDRRYLLTIRDKFNGGPVGVGTIAATVSEPEDVILTIREPYMLSLGLLNISPRGRELTQLARSHLQAYGG